MRPGSKPPSSQTCSADGSTAPAGGLAREAPAGARYQRVLAVLPVAHEETRAELLPGRGRERSVDAVGEQARRPALVRSDLDHRLPADGLAALPWPKARRGPSARGSGRRPIASRRRRPCSRGRTGTRRPDAPAAPRGHRAARNSSWRRRGGGRGSAARRCSGRSPVWRPPATPRRNRRRTRPAPPHCAAPASGRRSGRSPGGSGRRRSAPCRPPARRRPPHRSAGPRHRARAT